MRRLVLALAVMCAVGPCAMVALSSCAGWNEPIVPKPTKDNPCGLTWHSCGNHACCTNDRDCGGITPGCPAGSCCFAGGGQGDLVGAKLRVVPQRPESDR